MPETGFATHDAPTRTDRLLAERAELRLLLRGRPPDRWPAFHQAELKLASANKELYWANYRLDHARKRLDQLGGLSQLRRQGRKERASTLAQIENFTDDVQKAEAKIARCEQAVGELRSELDRRQEWDADHGQPDSRLRGVDAELAAIGRQGDDRVDRRDALLLRRTPENPAWLDRMAEVAPPPLPGRDAGHGIDLGL